MDDLVSKLQEILGSEEGMQKLKSVASMLGMGENGLPDEKRRETAAPSDGGLDLSAAERPAFRRRSIGTG